MPAISSQRLAVSEASAVSRVLMGAAICVACQAAFAQVEFSDSTFEPSNWSEVLLISPLSDPNAHFTVFQQQETAYDGWYRRVEHTWTGASPSGSIWVAHVRLGAVYDPAVHGAIKSIHFSRVGRFTFQNKGQSPNGINLGSLVFQDGHFFTADIVTTSTGWTHASAVLSKESFTSFSAPTSLDFSLDGRPLSFGYVSSNGSVASELHKCAGDIDNWHVRIDPCIDIASQPFDLTACPDGTVVFAVDASGDGGVNYVWEWVDPVQPDVWHVVVDGANYDAGGLSQFVGDGSLSDTVSLSAVPGSDRGLTAISAMRCLIANECGGRRTQPASLRICPADFDCSGFIDTDDFSAFVLAFEAGIDDADFDRSGFVDTDDFTAFVLAFEAGC